MKSLKPIISMLALAMLTAAGLNGADAPERETAPDEESGIFEQPVGLDLPAAKPQGERTIEVKPDADAEENIVIGKDDPDSGDSLESIFSSDRKSLSTAIKGKIDPLMKEAAFQKRIGNNEGALQIYEKIIEIVPENQFARFNRGNTLIALERYDEALDELLPIMESNPNNFMIRNNVAWIYATANNIEIRNGQKAISLARDALMLAPSDYQIWNTLSEAYFVSARYEEAFEIAEISFQMALSAQADDETLRSMADQVRKCRQAMSTMSIME